MQPQMAQFNSSTSQKCPVEIRSPETLLDASSLRFTGRRHECRRGTQECVRHMGQQPNVKLFLRDPLLSAPSASSAPTEKIMSVVPLRMSVFFLLSSASLRLCGELSVGLPGPAAPGYGANFPPRPI